MSKKPKGLEHTYQVRLYPTPEQSHVLMAHCREYISTVNVLASALESDVIPPSGFSTKDFVAKLPSCVKNQALRDAHSVFKRSLELDKLPVLKKPICQWNNQNWQMEAGTLSVPVCLKGKIQQIDIACAALELVGVPGLLRLKKKRGKWIADVTMTQQKPEPSQEEGVMGIDLGIKVPAVVHLPGKGTRFFGNGRYQRHTGTGRRGDQNRILARDTQGHDTHKSWSERSQKQPHEEQLELLSTLSVHHLQG